MRILLHSNVYGWRMSGLLGKAGKWFLGFSKKPKVSADEPRLVSYGIDRNTCTLSCGGVEYYYVVESTSKDNNNT